METTYTTTVGPTYEDVAITVDIDAPEHLQYALRIGSLPTGAEVEMYREELLAIRDLINEVFQAGAELRVLKERKAQWS